MKSLQILALLALSALPACATHSKGLEAFGRALSGMGGATAAPYQAPQVATYTQPKAVTCTQVPTPGNPYAPLQMVCD